MAVFGSVGREAPRSHEGLRTRLLGSGGKGGLCPPRLCSKPPQKSRPALSPQGTLFSALGA